MAELPPPNKPSGIKPPSKIGRLCASNLPKPSVPPQTPTMNGASGSVRKLSDDLIKTRINEEVEENDDFTSDFYARRYSFDRKSSIGGLSSNDSLWGDISLARRLSEAGIRRTSDNSVILTEDTDSFIVGDRVWVGGTKPGRIAYIGETKFAQGDWAGIVLDEPIGKNDGAVGNTRYFQCEAKKGIFSKLTRLTRVPLALPESPSPQARTPVPSTPLASPPPSVRGSTASRSPPPSSVASTPAPAPTGELKIGERVIVMSQQGSKAGILRFRGPTSFAPGEWCGVELDDPLGKNDGTVESVRYFTCEPKFGLFAPIHKVSRSPTRNRRPSCQVHHNTTSMRRASSKESLTSSIASSVRTNNTSYTARKALIRPLSSPTSSTPKPSAQDLVKCKQDQINQLLKEKQMDRAALTNAAQQADDLERKLGILQVDYDKVWATMTELKVRNDVAAMEAAEMKTQSDRLKAKVDELQAQLEDVQFRAEEETIFKSDIQVANQQNEEKIMELEQLLLIEQTKNESLLEDAGQVKEALKKVDALQAELKYAISSKEEMEKTLKQELIDTIDRANRMEQSYNKAQDDLDTIMSDLKTDKAKLLEISSGESTKLENDVETLKAQNKEIQKLVDELENGRSKLMKTVENKQEEVAQLNQEVGKLKKKFEEEENEKRSALSRLESQVKDMDNLKSEYDNKCKELVANTDALEAATNSLKAATTELETLSTNLRESQLLSAGQLETIDSLKKEIETTKSSSLSQIEETSLSLEIERSKMKEELNQSLEMLKNRNVELEQARTICAELTSKISTVQADCNKMMGDIKEKDDKLADFKNLIASKDEAINQLKDNLSSEHGSSSKVIEDLNAKVKELTENLEKERSTMSTSVNEQANLVKEKDKIIEQLNTKSTSLESEVKSLRNIEVTLHAELDQVKKSLSGETETVEQLQTQLKTKETDISTKIEEISELKKAVQELKEGKSIIEDCLNASRAQLQKLELELGDSQRRLADATERCEELSVHKSKLENDMAQMIDSSSDSSSQLTRINAELYEKLKELDELKLSTAEAAREYKNREQELSQRLESIESSRDELGKQLETQKELNEAQNNLIQNNFKVRISELESQLEESVKTQAMTKKQKEELNEKMLRLERSLEELSGKLEDSVKSKEDVMKDLEDNKKLVEEGEKDKSDQSKEIHSLVSKIATLESEFKTISEEKHQLNKKLANLETVSSDSSAELVKLKNENSSLMSQIDALTNATGSEMSVMKKIVDEKDALIKNEQKIIEELKSKLVASEDELKIANKEIEGKNGELAGIKTLLHETEEVRQNIVKDKEALSNKNEKLEILAGELTERLKSSGEKESRLQDEIHIMAQRLENLESSLNASSKNLDALKESQKEKETELDNIRQSSTAKEAELTTRIEAMNKQLSELNIVLEMSQEEHKTEVDKLKQQENALAADLKKKEEDLVEASENLAKYKNELKMVSANNSETNKTLSEEVENLKKASETTTSSLNKKLKEQENEIKVKCDNEVVLNSQVKSLLGEVEMLKKKNDSLSNAKLNHESEVKGLSKERRKAEEEKEKLTEGLKESQAQVMRLKQQLETEVSNRAASSTDVAKLQSQLNMALQDKMSLDEKLRSTMDEMSRIKSTVETPQKSIDAENNGSTSNEDLNNWLEEKELADSQINFLNSIIVDMKKKNEELQAKLDGYVENGVELSPPPTRKKRPKVVKQAAPRLFCDICDMFDLHDTEDCPQQASDSPPPTPKHHRMAGSRQLMDRPFCHICEEFGHDASQCGDTETF